MMIRLIDPDRSVWICNSFIFKGIARFDHYDHYGSAWLSRPGALSGQGVFFPWAPPPESNNYGKFDRGSRK